MKTLNRNYILRQSFFFFCSYTRMCCVGVGVLLLNMRVSTSNGSSGFAIQCDTNPFAADYCCNYVCGVCTWMCVGVARHLFNDHRKPNTFHDCLDAIIIIIIRVHSIQRLGVWVLLLLLLFAVNRAHIIRDQYWRGILHATDFRLISINEPDKCK